jgi:hypothetical protein
MAHLYMILQLKPPFILGIFQSYVSHNQMVQQTTGRWLRPHPPEHEKVDEPLHLSCFWSRPSLSFPLRGGGAELLLDQLVSLEGATGMVNATQPSPWISNDLPINSSEFLVELYI